MTNLTAPPLAGHDRATASQWPRRGRDWMAMIGVGIVVGIDNVGFSITIAALLFAGPLAGGMGLAVSAAILSTIISGIVLAVFSRSPCHTGHVQDLGVAVLAQALAATAASLALPQDVRIATALFVVMLASAASGLLMVIAGRFGWGRIARYFPQSVLAGFLAGSGWLLVVGGLSVAVGVGMSDLLTPQVWTLRAVLLALPAVLLGGVLLVLLRVQSWPGTLLVVLLAGVAGFHALLWVMGLTIADAQALGWSPAHVAADAALPDLRALAGKVDWGVVAMTLPAVGAVAFLTMLGTLLNTSGLEAITGQDGDSNRELSVTGLSNLAIAAVAGPPAYVGFASTLMTFRAGIAWRGTGLVMAAVGLVGLVAAGALMAAMPVFVMAGLLLYLGGDILIDWLFRTYRSFSRAEWLVVVAILGTVIMLGFVEGLVAGLLIACVIFVWSYAAVPILRRTGSLRDFASTLARGPAEAALLRDEGDRVAVVEVQGFLFFGTADQLRDHVRKRITDRGRPPLVRLIVDFTHVVGLDAAAAAQLDRIATLTTQAGVHLALSGCRDDLRDTLLRAAPGLRPVLTAGPLPTLDEALEQAEDAVLARAPLTLVPAMSIVQRLMPEPEDVPHLTRLFATLPAERLERGAVLMRAGELADSLVFLEEGRVSVRAPSTGPGGGGPRLRAMSAGAILGDIGLALRAGRTADVVADTDVVLRRLTLADLARIEAEDARLSLAIYRLQSRALAEKIVSEDRIKGPRSGAVASLFD